MHTARSPESFTYQYATTSLSIRYSAAHTLASTHALLLQVISVDGAEHEDETAQNPAATDHVFILKDSLFEGECAQQGRRLAEGGVQGATEGGMVGGSAVAGGSREGRLLDWVKGQAAPIAKTGVTFLNKPSAYAEGSNPPL